MSGNGQESQTLCSLIDSIAVVEQTRKDNPGVFLEFLNVTVDSWRKKVYDTALDLLEAHTELTRVNSGCVPLNDTIISAIGQYTNDYKALTEAADTLFHNGEHIQINPAEDKQTTQRSPLETEIKYRACVPPKPSRTFSARELVLFLIQRYNREIEPDLTAALDLFYDKTGGIKEAGKPCGQTYVQESSMTPEQKKGARLLASMGLLVRIQAGQTGGPFDHDVHGPAYGEPTVHGRIFNFKQEDIKYLRGISPPPG